jgi:3-oxoacyl-[acyl-carrier protein] reductase
MSFQLEGKRALVSGSSSGIGRAIATMLAAEGASVVVHGRDVTRTEDVARRICENGGIAKTVTGTLDTDESAADVANGAQDAFGGIDILVNNAGGRMPDMPVPWFSVPPKTWNDTYNLNVTSAIRLNHLLIEPMTKAGWGRIVHISSFAAHGTSGGVPEYAAAKIALANVSLALAKALTQTGVTVNTISPGETHTDNSNKWLLSIARDKGFGDDLDKAWDWVLKNTIKQTVKRMGRPEDVAYATCFLCSPRADFISATNIHVDGGSSPSVQI